MTWQETIRFFSSCLPAQVGRVLARQKEGDVREIRLYAGGRAVLVTAEGASPCAGTVSAQQLSQVAEALCEHALYARAEEQRQGYVALRGGHRMGLCGRVVTHGQSVRALREISSLCIRVAGQWPGAADALQPYLMDEAGHPLSTLLIGMPGTGKTTLLRDACRRLSDTGLHVGVVDERSEIAAMLDGVAQLDVGTNTDVLDGCCKETGIRWLVRAMTPDVLATDELGGALDAQAVLEAARSGVKVMATLHGREVQTALSGAALNALVQRRAFDRYVQLEPDCVGKIRAVYDAQLKPLA